MEINKLRSIIKEAVSAYNLKEIEEAAETAAMEAKLEAYDKAIQQCEAKIDMAESLEEMKDLVEPARLNELKKHLKNLQKSKEKLEKVKAKKNKGKEVVTDEPMDESYVEEDAMESMDNAIVPEMEEEALNESFLKMQKLAGVITETQYNQKKRLIENEVTNNPVIQKLEKKAFDFVNQPQVAALIKKGLDKLSPEAKAELAKTVMQEGEGDDFSSFKATIDKVINDSSLTEDLHDLLRQKVGGYKKDQKPNDLDKYVGKILVNLGVTNIMSMGFLPALTSAALDYFGGTNILQTAADAVGSAGLAGGLSIMASLLGGMFLWKMGKIMRDERDDYIEFV